MKLTTLRRLGWDDHLSTAYQPHDRPDRWPARVSHAERGVCTLLGGGEVRRASVAGQLLAVAARDPSQLPCPGDWVVVRSWPDARCTIEAILPRRGTVWRAPGPGPVASNVDVVITIDRNMSVDADLVRALRCLVGQGRTLGLVGADGESRAALVTALAGTTVLAPPGGSLVPLPGGGAVIDAEGDRYSIESCDIDKSLSRPRSLPRRRVRLAERPATG